MALRLLGVSVALWVVITLGAAVVGQTSHLFSSPALLVGGPLPGGGFLGGSTNGILADVDQDGDADLISGFGTAGIGISRASGSTLSWPPVVLSLAGGSVAQIVAVDLDADGDLDLVAIGYAPGGGLTSQVMTYVNDGTGTFSAPIVTMLVALPATQILAGRLNTDAFPDILVLDGASSNGAVLLGLGNGAFSAPSLLTLPFGPIALADDDLDGDDDIHIRVGFASMSTARNDGTGTFSALTPTATFANNGGLAFADVDLDGDLDAVGSVSTFAVQGAVQVAYSDGAGGFTLGPVQVIAADSFTRFRLADVDGDALPDLIGTQDQTTGRRHLLASRNGGGGSFLSASVIPALPDLWTIDAGDVTGNGFNDIVAIGGLYLAQLIESTGPGGLLAPVPVSVGAPAPGGLGGTVNGIFRLGDLNNDGRLDAITGAGSGPAAVLAVNLSIAESAPPLPTVYPAGATVLDIAMGDWNRDGRTDVLMARGAPLNDVTVILGNGQGGFSGVASFPVAGEPSMAKAADVNGDGNLDVVLIHGASTSSVATVSVLLGNGSGGLLPPQPVTLCSVPCSGSPLSIALADLDLDGDLDLVANLSGFVFGAPLVAVLLGTGTGAFVPLGTVPSLGGTVFLEDVNGDGFADLLQAGNGTVRIGDGLGGFGPAGTINFIGPYVGGLLNLEMAVGDVTGDGAPDIVFDRGATFVNDGSGQFSYADNFVTGTTTQVAIADVDRNARSDLVFYDTDYRRLSIFYNRLPSSGLSVPFGIGCPGTGGFVPALSLFGSPMPGGNITISVRDALGGAPALLMAGAFPSIIPMAPGCSAFTDPFAAAFIPLIISGPPVAGAGRGSLAFTLPVATPFNTMVTLQAIVADPVSTLGVSASGGLLVVIR